MAPGTRSLHARLLLHTRLFDHCLAEVDDEKAQKRPNEKTNHLAFIACHLTDARFFLARLLGDEVGSPFRELKGVRRVEDMRVAPSLTKVREAWTQVTAVLSVRLATISAEERTVEVTQEFPLVDRTLRGALLFLLHHEASHIGQMGLTRKFLGLGPMRYD